MALKLPDPQAIQMKHLSSPASRCESGDGNPVACILCRSISIFVIVASRQ
ncbi:hypothetical protein CAter282_1131 [Collimonas arenae]|uniref:Uncharacterized protein n=1 Tax=Collimonas arenae TaxID=279058 RepID=A0A127PMK1_9BURK|nr:hypothetical protein CAter10_1226 [Collimonas arenae]AMP08922.1 hypothetical protein CAter282_1131 [Collimonas arenae]